MTEKKTSNKKDERLSVNHILAYPQKLLKDSHGWNDRIVNEGPLLNQTIQETIADSHESVRDFKIESTPIKRSKGHATFHS